MSWSAEQLRWLRALGHEPLLLAPAGAAVGAGCAKEVDSGGMTTAAASENQILWRIKPSEGSCA